LPGSFGRSRPRPDESSNETLDTFDAISAGRSRDPANHRFAPEGHLNAIGNQVIAETIATTLQRLG
jgi:hypothetical protein